MTAGNDVVDLSKWNGTGSVNIGDIFSSDNDKVTVMAKNLAAGADLKLTSIENLEIVNSGTTASVALNSTNFKGLEAIKLIGDATTLDVSALTQGVKIDATAKADYIFGSDKADTINGGAGNDTIVGNDGDDVLTGGNGADTFVVETVKAAGVDQILDFSAEDKISMVGFNPGELKKFDASTFSTVTYKTLDSVLATFGSGGANVTGSGDVVIFSYDGKTYALLAKEGAFTETGSALVDITGANVASLTESNFGGAANPTPPTPIPPAPPVEIYPDYEAFVNAVAFDKIPAGKLANITTLTGAEAGMLAVNKAYLDKIAAGGIKNVTGDIVVTVSKTGEASDNFDSAAFANKLAAGALGSGSVMNITGTDKADVIIATFGGEINGSGGADTITANAAATINGGAENDTIYLKAGGSVDGGAGEDKIYVSGSGDATITGGNGKDTISLGAGKDTVVFSSKSSADANTITNFGANDVLQFTKTSQFDGLGTLATSGALKDVSTQDIQVDAATSGVTTIYKGALNDLKAHLKGKASNDTGKVIVAVATDAGDVGGIYALTLRETDTVTTVAKVGTLTGVDLDTLTMSNFAAA